MAYCGPRGIPHSFFLGGPHTWTEADRDKALAWQEMERQTCRCGTRPDEWDPEQGGDPNAWEFTSRICPGCRRLEIAQEQIGKTEAKGLHIYARRPKPPPS